MAALFTASTLVPVATVSADVPAAKEVKNAVFVDGKGNILTLDILDYADEFIFLKDIVKSEQFQYVQADNGLFYDLLDYADEFGTNGKDVAAAFAALDPIDLADAKEGKVEDGLVVAKDEQPEDRLNETFFYNVA